MANQKGGVCSGPFLIAYPLPWVIALRCTTGQDATDKSWLTELGHIGWGHPNRFPGAKGASDVSLRVRSSLWRSTRRLH